MHGLEHGRPCAVGIEVGRSCSADAAGDRAAEVGQDVAEEVVGDDHIVALRVFHEIYAGRIGMVVDGFQIAVFGDDFVECALPEVACEVQHIRLVHHS